MSSSSVKVAVRVRPQSAREILASSSNIITHLPNTTQLLISPSSSSQDAYFSIAPQKSFTYDYVFGVSSTQTLMYQESVKPLVNRFLEGFNTTILAYGQTGSGKTYSMGIALENLSCDIEEQTRGIVPRAIDEIFQYLDERKAEHGDLFKSSIFVSFLELYNEDVVDLLNTKKHALGAPSIREDGNGKIVWVNVTEEETKNTAELLELLHKGSLSRTTGSTDMNASSSRSHAIFTVKLKQEFPAVGATPARKLVSQFHFVDLAGSERLKRTNAEGDRKKEGISINQGLLALGNVISALGDETRKSLHVPYRDSKLTRMLQDSLGGNSQTLMLACVSPSDINYGETVNTLHYANRARNIKNRVVINQEWMGNSFGIGGSSCEKEILSLRGVVSQLRTEIALIRAGAESTGLSMDSFSGSVSTIDGNMIQQRRERDLKCELTVFKAQQNVTQYRLCQAEFYTSRLVDRVKEMLGEIATLSKERDVIRIEKARLLMPIDDLLKAEVSHEEDTELYKTVQGYQTTIAQLRMSLSEAEDKILWQREAMTKLGSKPAPTAELASTLSKLGVAVKPVSKLLRQLKTSSSAEIVHEKLLMRGIRENHDIMASLDPEFGSSNDLNRGTINDIEATSLSGEYGNHEVPGSDPDVYLLINKLQNDISQHEALVARIQRRDAEYEVMKKAYEQKLLVLQHQMSQFQTERDLALSKMQSGPRAQAKTKFDEDKRLLDLQISDYKRKLGDNSRMQSNNRTRSDALTKELHATIESLKNEKSRILLELRKESQKLRDQHTSSQREIAKLKRKEKFAVEATKRLEKSNVIQRAILKRRNDDVVKSQSKLRGLMNLLKRSSTPNRIFKPNAPRSISPLPTKRVLSGSSANASLRLAFKDSIGELNSNLIVRAQFKKQLVDKELDEVIVGKRTQKQLNECINFRTKLVGEQRELINERTRVVHDNFLQTNIHEPEMPQYMDERVQRIDIEIGQLDIKMNNLEALVRNQTIANNGDSDIDLNWENAIGLLKSLDRVEMEASLSLFLQDVLLLRMQKEEQANLEAERENVICNLKRMVEALRTAMSSQQLPDQRVDLITRIPSPMRSDPTDSSIVKKNPETIFGIHEPDSTQLDISLPIISVPLDNHGRTSPFRPNSAKVKLDLVGSDVFQRLANSHTLASQAKVISRSSVTDSEGAVVDICL